MPPASPRPGRGRRSRLERRGTLRDEHLEPADDPRARPPRRLCRCRLRVREIDEHLAAADFDEDSSRSEVALTTRSASSTAGGQSARRENRRACGSAWTKAVASPPSPRTTGRSAVSSATIAASVDAPRSAGSHDQRVHGQRAPRPAEAGGGVLVRARHVRAGEAQRTEAAYRVGQAVRRGRERHVHPVQLERGEGRVLHRGESECSTGQPRMPTSRVVPEIPLMPLSMSASPALQPFSRPSVRALTVVRRAPISRA